MYDYQKTSDLLFDFLNCIFTILQFVIKCAKSHILVVDLKLKYLNKL